MIARSEEHFQTTGATWAWLACAALLAFILGMANLGAPSLWHDESVHVFVAKNIVETGTPQHNTGVPYYSGTTFNYLLAFAIKFWGWGEQVVRTPSVIVGTINVLLIFVVVRPLLGARVALVSAFALALNPWSVGWSREARFYGLQQCFYLLTVGGFWRASESARWRAAVTWGVAAGAAYSLGLLTAFHSGLFLSGLGIYAAATIGFSRSIRSRWSIACAAIGAASVATIAAYFLLMNSYDRYVVYGQGGLGGELIDAARAERMYYTAWLRRNLSTGLVATAFVGFVLMLREGRRGLLVNLAFWVPILLLTFVIGYRRPRFMFFAFPFFVTAAAYAWVVAGEWLLREKERWWEGLAAVGLALFSVRAIISMALLVGDSVEVAMGSDYSLARLHPRWKEPCQYVRETMRDDDRILTTTYLPTLYYVGRVDNWYPTRALWGEVDEAGTDDLKGLAELKAYVAENPKGFFLSHWWRFERNPEMAEERLWVEENMKAIWPASSLDITVYRWDTTEDDSQ